MRRTFIPLPRSQGPVAAWKPPHTRDALPTSSDRSAQFMPVVDQGDRGGACVGNAGLALTEFTRKVLGLPDLGRLSRLFSYFHAMEREAQGRGLKFVDGVAVKSLLDSMTAQGYCRESAWGYDLGRYHTQPSGAAYQEAFHHRIPITYPSGLPAYSVLDQARDASGQHYDLNLFKQAIAPPGHCFMFAFLVWDNLRLENGVLAPPLPSNPINPGMDGHAVVAVGYDDARQVIKCRGSYGPKAHDGTGHFGFPYDLMRRTDLTYDHFTIDALRDL